MEYLRYWSFREPPFGPAASRFFFLGRPQRETLAWIQDQVHSQSKSSLMTSQGGCGLTALFSRVADSHGFDDCATEVVLTSGRHGSVDRVHHDLAKTMGIPVRRNSLAAIGNAVSQLQRRSIRSVWLIDGIGKHAADAVVQINRQCPSMGVIGAVTPRLQRLVSRRLGKGIAQASLEALNESETIAFMVHSMQTAGCRKQPFSDQSMKQLYRSSHGRIKFLAQIAQRALVSTARDGARQVTAREILSAVECIDQAA